jgi:hypothetical protein
MKLQLWSIVAVVLLACQAVPAAQAHEVPNMEHSHAFEQNGYGSYRQGHYVNGPQGSIIIWSPRTYTGYQNGSAVRFARPTPITRAPGTPLKKRRADSDPSLEYGKKLPDRR